MTGRLRGPAAQLTALMRLGLAFRHPRPPHDFFLTPQGHRSRALPLAPEPQALREGGAGAAPASGAGSTPHAQTAPDPAHGVFAARTGDEPHADDGPGRARQVRSAWQGLIELRRMTRPDAATDRPCSWERAHLVRAAALALEADGCRPGVAGSGGYRVTCTPQPEAVAVHAPTPAELRACATALERAGWQPGEHRDRRTGARYLLASPRRT